MSELTHLDDQGAARMVDVGAKPETERAAVARATVKVSPQTASLVAAGDASKGDVAAVALDGDVAPVLVLFEHGE